MKLKKVGAICNADGHFYLMDQKDDEGNIVYQWLGDGKAVYPMVGLPVMDVENICAMFDISEKRRDKLVMREMDAPDTMRWEDTDPLERQLDDPKLCLRYDGMELLPLKTTAGVTFIQEKYLLPLDGLEYMQLYERKTTAGGMYIVAKIGMILQAVIMPMDLPNMEFMNTLNELMQQCRDAVRIKALVQKVDNVLEQEPGPLLREGGDTGEGTA